MDLCMFWTQPQATVRGGIGSYKYSNKRTNKKDKLMASFRRHNLNKSSRNCILKWPFKMYYLKKIFKMSKLYCDRPWRHAPLNPHFSPPNGTTSQNLEEGRLGLYVKASCALQQTAQLQVGPRVPPDHLFAEPAPLAFTDSCRMMPPENMVRLLAPNFLSLCTVVVLNSASCSVIPFHF